MEILITIKEKKIKISLMDNEKEKGAIKIEEDHSLSRKLLPSIDELLKKNKMTPRDIENMRVESDQDNSFTTTRIALTVMEAWNFVAVDK